MSTDIKIQETPAPPSGAEAAVLSVDAANGRTRGGDFNQNSLSFSRGPEVPAGSRSVSTYGVAGVSVSVKPTSANHLEGSNQGDHRAHPGDVAAASLASASGSTKGPRDAVGQAPFRKNQ